MVSLPSSNMGFCKLKGIRDRSSRIEDSVKKQNGYQERRLSKYLVGIEREHVGNMTLLRSQESKLLRRNSQLINSKKQREGLEVETIPPPPASPGHVTTGSLPLIRQSGSREGSRQSRSREGSRRGTRQNKMDAKKHKSDNPWHRIRGGSVVIQLLHVIGSANKGDPLLIREVSKDDRNIFSPSTSRPGSQGFKLPPLAET